MVKLWHHGNHDAVVAQLPCEQHMGSMMAAIQYLSDRLRHIAHNGMEPNSENPMCRLQVFKCQLDFQDPLPDDCDWPDDEGEIQQMNW